MKCIYEGRVYYVGPDEALQGSGPHDGLLVDYEDERFNCDPTDYDLESVGYLNYPDEEQSS